MTQTSTRTHSASKRSLRVTNIGPSASITAFMVRIDWTSAPIVKITARQEFLLVGKMVSRERHMVADYQVLIPAGKTLFFVESQELAGWYYVSDAVGCSCPGHRRWGHCDHAKVAQKFAAQPRTRQTIEVSQPELTPASTEEASPAAPLTAEEWKQAVKRNRAWQKAEKAKDLAKLEAVKASVAC